jgi:hypothetical protein
MKTSRSLQRRPKITGISLQNKQRKFGYLFSTDVITKMPLLNQDQFFFLEEYAFTFQPE